jgi:hypothetical protein
MELHKHNDFLSMLNAFSNNISLKFITDNCYYLFLLESQGK